MGGCAPVNALLRLRYVDEFRDRHGKLRRRFRRGKIKVPLPGEPGSREFMAVYERCMAGDFTPSPQERPPRPGTIDAAIRSFYGSAKFKALKPNTQGYYKGDLEKIRAAHGGKQIAGITRVNVESALADRVSTPDAARNFLVRLRALMQHALSVGMISSDPTAGLRAPRKKNREGFTPWPIEAIEQFRARHPLGTTARLALDLLYGTGQRRSDIVRMGRQHVRNGVLSMRQQKTGTLIEIPIVAEITAALDAMPASDNLTFLVMSSGRPFTPEHFTAWFRDRCAEAGLSGLSPHGLRKSSAIAHAERGATAHMLMSWHGWLTLSEAERYCRKADRRRLAAAAGKLMVTSAGEPSA